MRQLFAKYLLRPYISRELWGWGPLYIKFVGDHKRNDWWANAGPVVIRDKRYGYFRILDLRHWADRVFFFLKRWYDLRTQLVIDTFIQPGDNVLDVGANYGHFTLAAAKTVGTGGSVTSFEPNPRAYQRAGLHIDLNRLSHVELKNMGLSDEEAELTLSIPAINAGEASFAVSNYEDAITMVCPVKRLDDVVDDRKIAFIKIDVEGFETGVLRGALNTVGRDKPMILTEIVPSYLEAAGSSPEELADVLAPFGYTPFRLSLQGRAANQNLVLTPSDGASLEQADYLWLSEADAHKAVPYAPNA